MVEQTQERLAVKARLEAFLRPDATEMLFSHPIDHPSKPAGLCHCDGSIVETISLFFKGWFLETLLRLPFNGVKLFFLRKLGARIGENVHIAPGAWIDPVYPQLLTIEDNAQIGMFAKIFFHEFRMDEFRAGRVHIGEGALVGATALIGCGVTIGSGATVAAGAVVAGDVPSGATVVGNPPRILGKGS